jgi:hypothetical protein
MGARSSSLAAAREDADDDKISILCLGKTASEAGDTRRRHNKHCLFCCCLDKAKTKTLNEQLVSISASPLVCVEKALV